MSVLLLAAVLTAQAPAPATPSADELGRAYYLYLQGRVQEDANDVAGAIDSYRQASVLLPRSAEIRTALATLYARQNQMTDARREATAALEINPSDKDAHRLLGGIQTAMIETSPAGTARPMLTEAINHLERSLSDGGSDPPVELALSSLYLRSDEAPKAIARLRKILVDEPDYPAARRLLIRAYEASGQKAEALAAREALAGAPPDEIEIRARQAEQLERQERWADAVVAWGEVVRGDPGATIYITRYATALANSGRPQVARTVLLQATRDSPRDVAGWYLLSLVEARGGNAEGAESAAKHIAEIDPNDARGPLALARARAASDDYRGAVNALSARVAKPQPEDLTSGYYVEMATELSSALGRLGQHKQAAEVLEGARKHAPKDEFLLFRLGAAYEQGRKYDLAERAFRELISSNAKHADALNYLGYMLADRGQKLPEAIELIKRALAVEADNPAFLDSLGWAYFKLGQFDSARQPLERAANALPRASVIHEHLGDLYVQLKQYSEAAAAFDRALAGDRDGIDAPAITKKRDRARSLVGKS